GKCVVSAPRPPDAPGLQGDCGKKWPPKAQCLPEYYRGIARWLTGVAACGQCPSADASAHPIRRDRAAVIVASAEQGLEEAELALRSRPLHGAGPLRRALLRHLDHSALAPDRGQRPPIDAVDV